MTTEQKMKAIEEHYINGNIQDAIKLFKRLPVAQRKEYAVNALYLVVYECMQKAQLQFAELLIRNI